MTRLLSTILATALVVLGASAARAQFDAQAADRRALQLYEQGDAAYQEARYADAAEAFQAAYRLSPRPLLLYNLANAYERMGRTAEAVDALERYLPNAPIDERAVIETRIRNLRALLAGGSEPASTAEAGPSASTSSGAGSDGDALVAAGAILLGSGGALLAGGVVFAALTLDARASLGGDACRETRDGRTLCTGSQGAAADAELYALLADIGLFGGAAIAATGLILLLVGISGGGASDQAFVPELRVGPSGAHFGLRGSF